MKAVKKNDTSYLSWGSSPKIAAGLLRLVGVETRLAAVCPPLLLSLQLQLLHAMDSFASVTLPCLGSIDVLVQRLLYVVALHPSSPSYWLMAPKPRDEDVHLMRFGAPPELELVDRRPGACRVHSSVLALCHDEPPASC